MKEVLKALRPVKARIRRNRFLRGAAAGLAAGLGAAVLLQAAAFFFPVPDRGLWALAAAGTVLLLAAAGAALRPVSSRTAAEAADHCGLEERAVTALEDGESEIRRLQRKDALAALENLEVKRIRPGSVKKSLIAAGCCAVLLAALLLIPNEQDGKAAQQKAFRKTLREGTEAVERAAEEDERNLPPEERGELHRITGDLRNELEHSRDEADAMLALEKADKRLEQLRQKTAGDAEAAGEGSAGAEANPATGKDGKPGETETAQSAAGQPSGAETAGQPGTDGRQNSTGNGQLKTQSAVSALKTQVNPSSQQAAAGQAGSASAKAQGSQSGQGSESGQGAGMNGQAKQGGGAGEGTTNLDEGIGGSADGGHQAGSRDPKYKESAYETIYDPERTGVSFRDETTNQNRLSDEGSVQIETGPGKGTLSGDVPWGEALRDYADTETRAADRENLTTRERQWVTEYFTLLAEQN